MTILVYFLIGFFFALACAAVGVNLTDRPSWRVVAVLTAIIAVAWPLYLLYAICFGVWCRIKPEHRIQLDIVEKD